MNTPTAHQTYASPVGELHLYATPAGLLRLSFFDLDTNFLNVIEAQSPILEQAKEELEQYFSGDLEEFSTPLGPKVLMGLRNNVLDQLMLIPYGSTLTYTALARAVGNPLAVRAVASACASNPIPIFIPCHRVLPKHGGTGKYVAGANIKRFLLNLEQHH